MFFIFVPIRFHLQLDSAVYKLISSELNKSFDFDTLHIKERVRWQVI